MVDRFRTLLGRFIVRHIPPFAISVRLAAEAHDLEGKRSHVLAPTAEAGPATSCPAPTEGPSHGGRPFSPLGRVQRYPLVLQRSVAYPARPARPLPRGRTEPASGTNIAAAQSSAKRKLASSASPFYSILQIHSPYSGNAVDRSSSALNALRILLIVVLGRSHLCYGRI